MAPPTRNPLTPTRYLDENGDPTTTPPPPSMGPPHQVPKGGLTYAGGDPIAWAEAQMRTLPPTTDSLRTIIAALKAGGVAAEFDKHGAGFSDDKVIINGKGYDFIQNVGAPDAGWIYGAQTYTGAGGTLGGGFDLSQYDTGPFTKPWGGSFPTFQKADPFRPPSYEEAANEPGYKFAYDQGRQAMEQSAAARGLLNTGGTLKDFDAYGQGMAAMQYGNVYNRAANTYQTNYGTQTLDPYTFAYQNALQNYSVFRNRQNDSWDKIFASNSA